MTYLSLNNAQTVRAFIDGRPFLLTYKGIIETIRSNLIGEGFILTNERVSYMADQVLRLLKKSGEQKISVITRMLRNDTKETREAVTQHLLLSGLVSLHSPDNYSARGPRPTYVAITPAGEQLIGNNPCGLPLKRGSVWAVL